jgi:uncharacterized membrane protein YjjP (DUF1212 family)
MAIRGVARTLAPDAHAAEATAFLLTLAQALHAGSLPADAIEARLAGVARGLGLDVEVAALQTFLIAEVRNHSLPQVAIRRIPVSGHWNLRRLTALTALCQGLEDGRVSLDEGRAHLANILGAPAAFPKRVVTIAYVLYGAVVAVRVGGALMEMLVGALVGLVVALLHFGALSSRTVDLQKSFLAALCGTLVALAMAPVLPPFDVARAVFGGITLLVPAMVIVLGTHEIVSESVEAGITRLAYGLLRLLMMVFGVTAAAKLWSLGSVLPTRLDAQVLPAVVTLALVVAGGVALVVCLQGRARDVPWMVLAVLLAYAAQEAAKLVVGGRGSAFAAALIVGVAAQLFARWPGHFAATILVPGFLQLVPGFLGTQAVLGLLDPVSSGGAAGFFDVFLVALQLVTGLVVAELIVPTPWLRRTA